jgi:hypothetical protein
MAFKVDEKVRVRVCGGEVRASVCALLGLRASVRITEAPHRPRLVGTNWCIYQRRLTRVLDSGELFPSDSQLPISDSQRSGERATAIPAL